MTPDPVVTASYLVTLSAPVAAYIAIRYVRRRDYDVHRLVQSVLLVVCWIAVLALELRIRFAGGSGVFVDRAAPDIARWAHRLLAIHISIAVATYLAWTWLAIASRRRYHQHRAGSRAGIA